MLKRAECYNCEISPDVTQCQPIKEDHLFNDQIVRDVPQIISRSRSRRPATLEIASNQSSEFQEKVANVFSNEPFRPGSLRPLFD